MPKLKKTKQKAPNKAKSGKIRYYLVQSRHGRSAKRFGAFVYSPEGYLAAKKYVAKVRRDMPDEREFEIVEK